jgi:hypothetical protein
MLSAGTRRVERRSTLFNWLCFNPFVKPCTVLINNLLSNDVYIAIITNQPYQIIDQPSSPFLLMLTSVAGPVFHQLRDLRSDVLKVPSHQSPAKECRVGRDLGYHIHFRKGLLRVPQIREVREHHV